VFAGPSPWPPSSLLFRQRFRCFIFCPRFYPLTAFFLSCPTLNLFPPLQPKNVHTKSSPPHFKSRPCCFIHPPFYVFTSLHLPLHFRDSTRTTIIHSNYSLLYRTNPPPPHTEPNPQTPPPPLPLHHSSFCFSKESDFPFSFFFCVLFVFASVFLSP